MSSSQYACIWLFLAMRSLWEVTKTPKSFQASLGTAVSEKQLYALSQVETMPLWSLSWSNMSRNETIVWFCSRIQDITTCFRNTTKSHFTKGFLCGTFQLCYKCPFFITPPFAGQVRSSHLCDHILHWIDESFQ